MQLEFESLLKKYDISQLEEIIKICKKNISEKSYQELFDSNNNFKFIKLNHEFISGLYDKYDRCNNSYSEDLDFDIIYNNVQYNVQIKIYESNDWWLEESDDIKLYIYEFYIEQVKIANYYSGYINEDKIKNTNTNLFEVYNFELQKLGLNFDFLKKIMEIFGYTCDYEPVFINEEKNMVSSLITIRGYDTIDEFNKNFNSNNSSRKKSYSYE